MAYLHWFLLHSIPTKHVYAELNEAKVSGSITTHVVINPHVKCWDTGEKRVGEYVYCHSGGPRSKKILTRSSSVNSNYLKIILLKSKGFLFGLKNPLTWRCAYHKTDRDLRKSPSIEKLLKLLFLYWSNVPYVIACTSVHGNLAPQTQVVRKREQFISTIKKTLILHFVVAGQLLEAVFVDYDNFCIYNWLSKFFFVF
jgi:hypothetical protein